MTNENALKLLKQSLIVGDKTALIREAIKELEDIGPMPMLPNVKSDYATDEIAKLREIAVSERCKVIMLIEKLKDVANNSDWQTRGLSKTFDEYRQQSIEELRMQFDTDKLNYNGLEGDSTHD